MDKSGGNLHSHRFIKQNSVHEPEVLLIPHRENIPTCLIKKKSFSKYNDVERALIWILTPATSGEKKPSSSMCWHRNIMVHKCFCAMKQIGRSKYTAKNQTICFKRSQELLKTSWNTAAEKAAAAPVPEAGWHCSSTTCSSTVLPSWPPSHGNGASNEQEKSLLLSPELLQDGPELGERKLQNCLGLTTYLWGTGVPFSGDITVLI